MGAILGLGVTHQPTLGDADFRPGSFMQTLADPELPEALRDPTSWPPLLRDEWSDDKGAAAGRAHRSAVQQEYLRIRQVLDDFRPDYVVIWGDDQYERFRENCVPPFCVVAQDRYDFKPWDGRSKPNVWGEPNSHEMSVPGGLAPAKRLVDRLVHDGFDVSYSYRSDEELSHAFVKTALYLDWERRGLPYPIVPFAVNCYGRLLTLTRGGRVPLSVLNGEGDFDPPAPTPARCFDLGASVARAVVADDARVALIASSSWSHGFLAAKNNFLYPDLDADRQLYDDLRAGRYDQWRARSTHDIEQSGQQEMLNWFCLAGAMAELGRAATYTNLLETALYNSNKVFAVFAPDEGPR